MFQSRAAILGRADPAFCSTARPGKLFQSRAAILGRADVVHFVSSGVTAVFQSRAAILGRADSIDEQIARGIPLVSIAGGDSGAG